MKRKALVKPKQAAKATPRRKSKAPKPIKPLAARKKARRVRVAGALLAGKTVTEVAKREGISREWASKEANSREVRLAMADLLARHKKQIARLVGKSLNVIDKALVADKKVPDKEGHAVNLGSDHFARLTAVKRLVEMVAAAKAGDAMDTSNTITYEMFLRLYAEVMEEK
jgi:hypothetical protein